MNISLEFFPPRTPEGAAKLRTVRQQLYALKPEFCSVTYGAGGTTQSGTFSAVQEIQGEGQQAASHLTCVGSSTDSLRAVLDNLKAIGVKRIVALRGDPPGGYYMGSGDMGYASDLVAFIRAETGDHFHLEVAAYPDMHPQARSPQGDLLALVKKVQAGANSAITQYFYNAESYFRLRDEMDRAGLKDTPLVPGIMPINSSSQLMRFSDTCGADIPRWVRLRLMSFGDDTATIKSFGLEVVTRLCEQLRAGGVPALHFYTMNQSASVLAICQNLGLVARTAG